VLSRSLWASGLDAALHGAGLPYGYTLTIWASGQVMIDSHGKPGVVSALGVVLGAAAAFGALKFSARAVAPETSASQLAADSHLVRTGAIHVTTIAAAVGAVALIALIPTAIVWALGAATATGVYLLGTGFALGLRELEDDPSSAD
jgi:divalent metal cation (Fe/Co/Zn/Cd) transporter